MKLFLFNNEEKLLGTTSPISATQKEELNSIQTLEAVVRYSELVENAVYIGHKDYIKSDVFHLYKIDTVTKHDISDVKITAVNSFYDDMESDGYIKDYRPMNRDILSVLTTILTGSRWQVGTCNAQRNLTSNFYYVTRKAALSKVIEATQVEIRPRYVFNRGKIVNRYLDVYTRLGRDNGKVFVHGKDLLTVSEKKSKGAIYTAVVGRGKGEETDTGGYGRRITFKDVVWDRRAEKPVDKPAGQEYVEIPAMTRLYGFDNGKKPRIKIVEFQDEENPEKLLWLSYQWLEKNSRIQVEYSATVVNVGNLDLGDTVGISNTKLGIKYKTRVFKVERNLINNRLTKFGIGDKVTTSPFSRTIELAKDMKNFQDDTIYWLDKIRERLSDKFLNEDGYNYDLKANNEYNLTAGYYSFDKPINQNPTKVVYMGAGKIAIADSKKPTGEWNWRTFLDGRGASLDLINTGVLKAGRIQSADGSSYWDLDSGAFHIGQQTIEESITATVNAKKDEIVAAIKKDIQVKDGVSSYIHKKYSNFADGRNMNDNPNSTYLGLYTGTSKTAPTDYTQYSWTKIKGEDGARGQDGRDGKPVYFHTAYANSQDGRTDFSTTNNLNKSYIGTYSDNVQVDSVDPTKYKWVKVKGDNGKSAPNFNLLLNTEIKSSSSYTLNGAAPTINQNDLNGRNSVEINNRELTNYGWKGISFRSFKKEFKRGETIVIRLPIYIYSDVNVDNGITLALKSHVGNKTLTGFNLDNGTARDTWVIKEIEYTVQQDFTSPADNLFYIFSTKNGHFKIAEPYMAVDGDMPKDWMPSLEDLKAHSLTANVRVAGTYEGKKTNNIKFYVDVYYDGEKINNGFNLTAKVWGAGLNKTQENATYNNDGELTNVYYSNGEKDGTTINIKLDVEYQFLKTTCFARLDNLPDTELVKEITNKYKTFDSSLEQFRSQIGELNDKQFKVAIRGDNLLNSAEKKTGNNITYTTLEPMKPGNTYTLVADFRYFPANQELRIFNSERQKLVAGINMFTFTVPTETRTINLTPLGNDTEVKNVEVWEGNFNEGLEKNSFDAVTGGTRSFVAIKLKNEFKEGRYYKMVFDTTAPNNSVIAVNFTEYVLTFNGGKVIPNTNYKPMTAKDNVLFTRISEKTPDNKDFVYLEFTGGIDKSQITNVRFYEINLGFRYTKRDETVDIASLINQSKEEITLKLSKTLATDYMTKSQTETSIKLLRDKIENVVTDENFGTTLVQNAKSLKLAWNNYSKYFQFEDESLILYEGKAESAKKRVKLDYLGTSYYDQNGEFSGAIRGYYKSYFWGSDVGYYSGMNFVIKANGRVGWFEETEEWGFKTERALLAYNYKQDDNDNELKNTLISYVDFEVRGNSTFTGKTNIRHLLVAGADSDPEGYYEGRNIDLTVSGLRLKFRNGVLIS
ncbi:hypothetical protein O3822_07235 [Gemella sanguinis]|uniref:phage tail spike protein n=1 Tax=Gemella sanguinis TaxID=84135 RepID=UPI00352CFD00